MAVPIRAEVLASDAPPPPAAADLGWLDDEAPDVAANKAEWARAERLLEGGPAVIAAELVRFGEEEAEVYALRQASANLVNFGLNHATSVTGALSREAPRPGRGRSWGTLGDVRDREAIDGPPSLAEQLEYNATNAGADGMEFGAFMDSVDVRAQATGHRWLLCEMPALAAVRARARRAGYFGVPDDAAAPTEQDRLWGWRPYFVEFSPRRVPLHHPGDFAVIRTPPGAPRLVSGRLERPQPGYYVLVRSGFDGLGEWAAPGGWWKFDGEKRFTGESGTWAATRGQIPLWAHVGEPAEGTDERPARSRSSLAMLNQLAVGLMNLTSMRDHDFWVACKSLALVLGGEPATIAAIKEQTEAKSIFIGVPAVLRSDDSYQIPQIYDTSMGAVPADVARGIIDAKWQEAREEMFRQLTSAPESSGESKRAGYAEHKSPLLARRAKLRQQSEQTAIYFAELRAGTVPERGEPTGSSVWPTEFDLAPVAEAIDATLDRLRRAALRSPTLEAALVRQGAEEDGLWPEAPETAAAVEAELRASAGEPAPGEPEGGADDSAMPPDEGAAGGGMAMPGDGAPPPEVPEAPAPPMMDPAEMADRVATAVTAALDVGVYPRLTQMESMLAQITGALQAVTALAVQPREAAAAPQITFEPGAFTLNAEFTRGPTTVTVEPGPAPRVAVVEVPAPARPEPPEEG